MKNEEERRMLNGEHIEALIISTACTWRPICSGIRIEEAGKSQDRMAELQISHCEIPEAFCVDRDDLQLLPQSLISHETES